MKTNPDKVNEVANALQQKCIEIFGSNWNNDNARTFALTAIMKWKELEAAENYQGTEEEVNKMKEKRMTREQAINEMVHHRNYGPDGQNGWMLDNLEALGLIKFEEERKLHLSDIAVGTKVRIIFKNGQQFEGEIDGVIVL